MSPKGQRILYQVVLVAGAVLLGIIAVVVSAPTVLPETEDEPAAEPVAEETNPEAENNPETEPKTEAEAAKELAEKVQKTAEDWRKRLPEDFPVETCPPFVVAGNLTAKRLHEIRCQSVEKPSKALWKQYFRARPTEPVTILLFKDDKSYRQWAKKLFGDTRVSHFGYYRSSNRTMVMNIGTGTGTLVHEIVHALLEPDFPDCPTWFNEGLASLYEQCMVYEDKLVGLLNWRLPALKKALDEGRLRPLEELITKDDFRGALEGLNYAQARYYCMYMQERGLLEKFYRQFRENFDKDPTGLKTVQEVFGNKAIGEVDKAYREWVKSLQQEERR